MGAEQRRNDLDRTREQAEFERLVGPTRPFRDRDEEGCEKCGAPLQAFLKRWCAGASRLDPDPRRCKIEGEHLHALCQACGYGWIEYTKDHDQLPPNRPMVEP